MVKPVACVIGWPVKHSRSPVIHRYWLNELGIDGDYVIQPVEPERIAAFFAGFADERLRRLQRHRAAQGGGLCRGRTGARRRRRTPARSTPCGSRTASSSAPTPIRPASSPISTRRRPAGMPTAGPAVVLGAGGAARAVVWALAQARLRAGHRRQPHAASAPRRSPTASAASGRRRLGVAAAPPRRGARAGQHHHARHARPAAARRRCRASAAATRWSTTSSMCRWRRRWSPAPRAAGLRAVGGLGMLLHQAVPGFTHWFGKRPTVTPALARRGPQVDRGRADARPRPHRFARHGQVDGGGDVRPRRHSGVRRRPHRPRPLCAGRRPPWPPSRRPFPA